MKNARRVDFMLQATAKGITEDPRKHVLTERARREASKKKRKRVAAIACAKEA